MEFSYLMSASFESRQNTAISDFEQCVFSFFTDISAAVLLHYSQNREARGPSGLWTCSCKLDSK